MTFTPHLLMLKRTSLNLVVILLGMFFILGSGGTPVITILGDNPVTVQQGSVYVDAGATAKDDDGPRAISTTGLPINTSVVGTFKVVYSVLGADGKTITAERVVHVVAVVVIDTTPPVITILGDNPASVQQGEAYTDAGATALDNVDANVAVSVTSTVDTTTAGEYAVTYVASDSAGNSVTAIRAVNVTTSSSNVNTIQGHIENAQGLKVYLVFSDGSHSTETLVDQDGNYQLKLTSTDLSKINPVIPDGVDGPKDNIQLVVEKEGRLFRNGISHDVSKGKLVNISADTEAYAKFLEVIGEYSISSLTEFNKELDDNGTVKASSDYAGLIQTIRSDIESHFFTGANLPSNTDIFNHAISALGKEKLAQLSDHSSYIPHRDVMSGGDILLPSNVSVESDDITLISKDNGRFTVGDGSDGNLIVYLKIVDGGVYRLIPLSMKGKQVTMISSGVVTPQKGEKIGVESDSISAIIPPYALLTNKTITFNKIESQGETADGKMILDMQPSGLKFDLPITVKIKYSDFGVIDPEAVEWKYGSVDGGYENADIVNIDKDSGVIYLNISHFSNLVVKIMSGQEFLAFENNFVNVVPRRNYQYNPNSYKGGGENMSTIITNKIFQGSSFANRTGNGESNGQCVQTSRTVLWSINYGVSGKRISGNAYNHHLVGSIKTTSPYLRESYDSLSTGDLVLWGDNKKTGHTFSLYKNGNNLKIIDSNYKGISSLSNSKKYKCVSPSCPHSNFGFRVGIYADKNNSLKKSNFISKTAYDSWYGKNHKEYRKNHPENNPTILNKFIVVKNPSEWSSSSKVTKYRVWFGKNKGQTKKGWFSKDEIINLSTEIGFDYSSFQENPDNPYWFDIYKGKKLYCNEGVGYDKCAEYSLDELLDLSDNTNELVDKVIKDYHTIRTEEKPYQYYLISDVDNGITKQLSKYIYNPDLIPVTPLKVKYKNGKGEIQSFQDSRYEIYAEEGVNDFTPANFTTEEKRETKYHVMFGKGSKGDSDYQIKKGYFSKEYIEKEFSYSSFQSAPDSPYWFDIFKDGRLVCYKGITYDECAKSTLSELLNKADKGPSFSEVTNLDYSQNVEITLPTKLAAKNISLKRLESSEGISEFKMISSAKNNRWATLKTNRLVKILFSPTVIDDYYVSWGEGNRNKDIPIGFWNSNSYDMKMIDATNGQPSVLEGDVIYKTEKALNGYFMTLSSAKSAEWHFALSGKHAIFIHVPFNNKKLIESANYLLFKNGKKIELEVSEVSKKLNTSAFDGWFVLKEKGSENTYGFDLSGNDYVEVTAQGGTVAVDAIRLQGRKSIVADLLKIKGTIDLSDASDIDKVMVKVEFWDEKGNKIAENNCVDLSKSENLNTEIDKDSLLDTPNKLTAVISPMPYVANAPDYSGCINDKKQEKSFAFKRSSSSAGRAGGGSLNAGREYQKRDYYSERVINDPAFLSYQPVNITVKINKDDKEITIPRVVLQKNGFVDTFTFNVKDGSSTALSGVNIDVKYGINNDSEIIAYSGTTDSTGKFEINQLAYGQYTAILSLAGYAPKVVNFTVSDTQISIDETVVVAQGSALEGIWIVDSNNVPSVPQGTFKNSLTIQDNGNGEYTGTYKSIYSWYPDEECGLLTSVAEADFTAVVNGEYFNFTFTSDSGNVRTECDGSWVDAGELSKSDTLSFKINSNNSGTLSLKYDVCGWNHGGVCKQRMPLFYKFGENSHLVRDDTKEIVTDNQTGLMWQDNSDASNKRTTWSGAKFYCKKLVLGGFSDWVSPTVLELESILDKDGVKVPTIDSTVFRYTDIFNYWASEHYEFDDRYAFYTSFRKPSVGDKSSFYGAKSYPHNVRCVRRVN